MFSPVTSSSSEQELEREIVELSIRWVEAKFSVEEALIENEWKRIVNLLRKKRRDRKQVP